MLVLETLTAAIPDSTFLTELRIEGDRFAFSGLGEEIETLVRALNDTPLFYDVRIDGALSTDDSGLSSFRIVGGVE